jgi:hypothetical protein
MGREMLIMLSWVIITAICAGQTAGEWKLIDRKDIVAEVPPNAKPYCTQTYDSGDRGLRLSVSCYSPVSRKNSVSSDHVGFELPADYGTVRAGQKLLFKGVVSNTGDDPNVKVNCSISWNIWNFATGQWYGRGSGDPCEGILAVPGPGMQPNGELIREARLILGLNTSTGPGVTRHLIYRWTPLQESAKNSLDTSGVWRNGNSGTWMITPMGTGKYRAIEQGPGNATGIATRAGGAGDETLAFGEFAE